MAAMSFHCCQSIAHFRYLFQKTTANPILDRGMITLLKPLHVTRIRVRAVHGNKSYRSDGSCEQSACERHILELLDVSSKSTTELLSEKLAQIKTEAELKHLYTEILDSSHIQTMWKIAGSGNNSGRVDPILPCDFLSPEKWIGMTWEIKKSIMSRDLLSPKKWIGIKKKILRLERFRLEDNLEMILRLERFRLEDNLEMLICRDILGNSGANFREIWGLLSVERNPNDHPDGEECDLAFRFDDGKQLGRFPKALKMLGSAYEASSSQIQNEWKEALKVIKAKDSWPSSDQYVVYVRCIGSNVWVGQVRKATQKRKRNEPDKKHKTLFGMILLVKRHVA